MRTHSSKKIASVVFRLFKARHGSMREHALTLRRAQRSFKVPKDAWGFHFQVVYTALLQDGRQAVALEGILEGPFIYYGGKRWTSECITERMRQKRLSKSRRKSLSDVYRDLCNRQRVEQLYGKSADTVFAVEFKRGHFEIAESHELWLPRTPNGAVDIKELFARIRFSQYQ